MPASIVRLCASAVFCGSSEIGPGVPLGSTVSELRASTLLNELTLRGLLAIQVLHASGLPRSRHRPRGELRLQELQRSLHARDTLFPAAIR